MIKPVNFWNSQWPRFSNFSPSSDFSMTRFLSWSYRLCFYIPTRFKISIFLNSPWVSAEFQWSFVKSSNALHSFRFFPMVASNHHHIFLSHFVFDLSPPPHPPHFFHKMIAALGQGVGWFKDQVEQRAGKFQDRDRAMFQGFLCVSVICGYIFVFLYIF